MLTRHEQEALSKVCNSIHMSIEVEEKVCLDGQLRLLVVKLLRLQRAVLASEFGDSLAINTEESLVTDAVEKEEEEKAGSSHYLELDSVTSE